MLLTLDVGNTNIVAGLFDGDQLAAEWRQSTDRHRTADELGAFLKIQFDIAGFEFGQVDGVAISSVVPPLTTQATRVSQRYFDCEPLVVGAGTDTGLVNAYSDPHAVGADRLVNGIAAFTRFQSAVVIADFGTGTTIDAVTHDGRYVGGAIAPGLNVSIDALFQAAARLPRVDLALPECALGRDTRSSIQAGIVFGYAGLTKELVGRARTEILEYGGDKVTVVATGGLAELIAPLVPEIDHIEPHLTLQGLRLIWERNRK